MFLGFTETPPQVLFLQGWVLPPGRAVTCKLENHYMLPGLKMLTKMLDVDFVCLIDPLFSFTPMIRHSYEHWLPKTLVVRHLFHVYFQGLDVSALARQAISWLSLCLESAKKEPIESQLSTQCLGQHKSARLNPGKYNRVFLLLQLGLLKLCSH